MTSRPRRPCPTCGRRTAISASGRPHRHHIAPGVRCPGGPVDLDVDAHQALAIRSRDARWRPVHNVIPTL